MHLEVSLLRERMVPLRDLSWQFFTMTGSVDAYLLYKDLERLQAQDRQQEANPSTVEDVASDSVH